MKVQNIKIEDINKKVVELKEKALKIVEDKLNKENIEINELKECIDCINSIQKDDYAYIRLLQNSFSNGVNKENNSTTN